MLSILNIYTLSSEMLSGLSKITQHLGLSLRLSAHLDSVFTVWSQATVGRLEDGWTPPLQTQTAPGWVLRGVVSGNSLVTPGCQGVQRVPEGHLGGHHGGPSTASTSGHLAHSQFLWCPPHVTGSCIILGRGHTWLGCSSSAGFLDPRSPERMGIHAFASPTAGGGCVILR